MFTRRLLALGEEFSEQVLSAIQGGLLDNPERGRLVPGLGRVRKARTPNPGRGKGKRGEWRYLYLYFVADQEIYLLYLLDKDEQEDLSPAQRTLMRDLATERKQ